MKPLEAQRVGRGGDLRSHLWLSSYKDQTKVGTLSNVALEVTLGLVTLQLPRFGSSPTDSSHLHSITVDLSFLLVHAPCVIGHSETSVQSAAMAPSGATNALLPGPSSLSHLPQPLRLHLNWAIILFDNFETPNSLISPTSTSISTPSSSLLLYSFSTCSFTYTALAHAECIQVRIMSEPRFFSTDSERLPFKNAALHRVTRGTSKSSFG